MQFRGVYIVWILLASLPARENLMDTRGKYGFVNYRG